MRDALKSSLTRYYNHHICVYACDMVNGFDTLSLRCELRAGPFTLNGDTLDISYSSSQTGIQLNVFKPQWT